MYVGEHRPSVLDRLIAGPSTNEAVVQIRQDSQSPCLLGVKGSCHTPGEHPRREGKTKAKNPELEVPPVKREAEKPPMIRSNGDMKITVLQVDRREPVTRGDRLQDLHDSQHVKRHNLEETFGPQRSNIGRRPLVFLETRK
ncbi:hypothetical protein ATANTOWER_024116 [Ataeniobius toweri]|uniref:Uncharacterized protein n=1 Tax=Ataeniobius toweri TaxID=208326 RepID=A0ABU7C381_9TELE|nr:hypothetical protein [Ataeniobius toweri]